MRLEPYILLPGEKDMKISSAMARITRGTLCSAIGGALLSAALMPALAHAEYVYQPIVFPGQDPNNLISQIFGIIAGFADIATLPRSGGAVYLDGTFANLPPPPSPYTIGNASAINDSDWIAGNVEPSDNNSRTGYLFWNGHYRSFFSYPGHQFTYVRGMNNARTVVGYAYNLTPCNDFPGCENQVDTVGFSYNPFTKAFTQLAAFPDNSLSIVQGINTSGQIVGDTDGTSFVRDPVTGVLTYFTVNGNYTAARGINDAGVITGYVFLSNGALQTFVGNPSQGFTVVPSQPGSASSGGEAINNSGQIVGFYSSATSSFLSYIASPAVQPIHIAANGAYVFSVPVIADTSVFIDPPVARGFDYSVGLNGSSTPFATVQLPIGVGDSQYTVIVNGKEYPVAAGEQFDFRAHGFKNGVSRFRVTDIEPNAALDPNNPTDFVTEVTFVRTGRFSGDMTPLCLPAGTPDTDPQRVRRSLVACSSALSHS